MSKICCICGAYCKGKQHSNRDTGYGICPRCATREKEKLPMEEMKSLYGIEGVNYFTEPPKGGEVTVFIRGGVAQEVEGPAGLIVNIMDYDNDESDRKCEAHVKTTEDRVIILYEKDVRAQAMKSGLSLSDEDIAGLMKHIGESWAQQEELRQEFIRFILKEWSDGVGNL